MLVTNAFKARLGYFISGCLAIIEINAAPAAGVSLSNTVLLLPTNIDDYRAIPQALSCYYQPASR